MTDGRTAALGRRTRDLIGDVLLEMSARRARSALMVVAVGLSTGVLTASLGISATASEQIGSDIAASALDRVTLSGASVPEDADIPRASSRSGPDETVFPDDAEERVLAVDLVAAAGRRLDVEGLASVSVVRDPMLAADVEGGPQVGIAAVTSGYLEAAWVETQAARAWMLDESDPVVFLGPRAAELLDVPATVAPVGLAVWLNDILYPVVGFLDGSGLVGTGLDTALVIPYQVGLGLVGSDARAQMLVRTDAGAGAPVARVVRMAVRPDAPQRLAVSQVASLEGVRRGVAGQLSRLVAGIGVSLLVLTVMIIANAMVVSVVARTPEIGLRRALGASRHSVAAVFLCEGAVTGVLGGLTGTALALSLVVGLSAANDWTPVLTPGLAVLGPAMGAIAGLLACAYPAFRAGRISPAVAVRAD